jgi:putative tricarboxylic transport membrane protein
MRTGEILAAAFWLAIALGVICAGANLGIGILSNPGPGLMMFWVGVVMAALSLATLVIAARQPAGDGLGSLWHGTRWWLVPYMAVLLALYAWLMPMLGFLTCTVAFLFILFMSIDRQSWIAPPLGAVFFTAAAYIVFHRCLGTQLPAGEAEIWLTKHLSIVFGRG